MRYLAIVILVGVLVFLIVQIGSFWKKEGKLSEQYENLKVKMAEISALNRKLQEDLSYLMNPANLEKKLKEIFSYRKIGEKLMIIVPKTSSQPFLTPRNN